MADTQWPGLRGPDFNGSVRGTNLLRDGATGLSVTWKRALGSGYSSVSVGDGRVVTMFAAGESDVVAGFDVDSGEEVWRYTIGETYTGHYGSYDGPLATPLLAGGRVYGQLRRDSSCPRRSTSAT